MNYMFKLSIIGVLILVLFQLNLSVSYGQRLPKVQTKGLRIPVNMKVDGKTTEWAGVFQAYNPVASIYYTIANDDEHLYLSVSATQRSIIDKMIGGGVTLTINSFAKKKDENSRFVTFPYFNEAYKPINLITSRPQLAQGTVAYKKEMDSLMHLRNLKLAEKLKLIIAHGFSMITDSVLSVYNEEGIKVKTRFDNELNYIYEMTVPLKLLGFLTGELKPFYYNIMLPGLNANSSRVIVDDSRNRIFVEGKYGYNVAMLKTQTNLDVVFPTDFWAQYIPVKVK